MECSASPQSRLLKLDLVWKEENRVCICIRLSYISCEMNYSIEVVTVGGLKVGFCTDLP